MIDDIEDLASQDLLDDVVLFRPTARSVMVGTALEDLAALSRCNGRGRRKESCLERKDSLRLLFARRGGGVS